MKILIPNATAPSEEGHKVTSKAIKLSEVTQGHHVGLIPVRMTGVNSTFERLYRMEVSGEASDNGKGYRRVMLKVNIPYHRIWTADPAAAANLREKQESTSAGSISMHVVLSIPSRVRQDLLESSDAAATRGAEGHLAVVGALLSALTGQLRKPTLIKMVNEAGGELDIVSPAVFTVDDEGKALMEVHSPYNRLDMTSCTLADVDAYDSERFGTVGLDLRNTSTDYLSHDPRDPLVRGLFGLTPIEENTNIVAGPSVVIRELAD